MSSIPYPNRTPSHASTLSDWLHLTLWSNSSSNSHSRSTRTESQVPAEESLNSPFQAYDPNHNPFLADVEPVERDLLCHVDSSQQTIMPPFSTCAPSSDDTLLADVLGSTLSSPANPTDDRVFAPTPPTSRASELVSDPEFFSFKEELGQSTVSPNGFHGFSAYDSLTPPISRGDAAREAPIAEPASTVGPLPEKNLGQADGRIRDTLKTPSVPVDELGTDALSLHDDFPDTWPYSNLILHSLNALVTPTSAMRITAHWEDPNPSISPAASSDLSSLPSAYASPSSPQPSQHGSQFTSSLASPIILRSSARALQSPFMMAPVFHSLATKKRSLPADNVVDMPAKRLKTGTDPSDKAAPHTYDSQLVPSATSPVSSESSSAIFMKDGSFVQRVFPSDLRIHPGYPLLYRRFPFSSHFAEDDKLGQEALKKSGLTVTRPRGWTFQRPRNAFDLYTPHHTKGVGDGKIGLCPICIEPRDRGGEGKQVALKTKVSAYNYHMQYYHGISCSTGLPFHPPTSFRTSPRKKLAKYEKTSVLEGACHKCKKWIPMEGPRIGDVQVKEVYWWKHAAKCHRRELAAEDHPHFEDILLQNYKALANVQQS